jgi:PiT family inorganic phosphate transporter
MFAMAFAEGANNIAKVVSTLVSSGISSYKKAIIFGTICSACGALAAVILGIAVAVTITEGIITPTESVGTAFALAALIGAMSWTLLATRIGIPIATTHAIIGAIIVLGVYAFGTEQVHWSSVMGKVVLPMVVSPLAAIPIALALFLILEPVSRRFSLTTSHWISSGAASFGRGVNDAPKVAALGAFFFLTGDGNWARVPTALLFVIVALGMTLGSLFASRRVTETLAERVAPIDNVEGLAANATTAFLLLFASSQGLPISLTYVISSSIVGLGFRRAIKDVCWRTVRKMVVSWVVTVPVSGLIAIGAFFVINWLKP